MIKPVLSEPEHNNQTPGAAGGAAKWREAFVTLKLTLASIQFSLKN